MLQNGAYVFTFTCWLKIWACRNTRESSVDFQLIIFDNWSCGKFWEPIFGSFTIENPIQEIKKFVFSKLRSPYKALIFKKIQENRQSQNSELFYLADKYLWNRAWAMTTFPKMALKTAVFWSLSFFRFLYQRFSP